ncbi:MAG TPA: transposase [Verrucomicrobiae bacterium]|nr:transposase [Verrucomicrobiae bacterium]
MRKSRFSEAQIVGILKELEAGAKASALCRKYGMSEATLYNWRSKYGGVEVSDLMRLRQLEDENRRVKKIVANQALNIEAIKIVAEGNF